MEADLVDNHGSAANSTPCQTDTPAQSPACKNAPAIGRIALVNVRGHQHGNGGLAHLPSKERTRFDSEVIPPAATLRLPIGVIQALDEKDEIRFFGGINEFVVLLAFKLRLDLLLHSGIHPAGWTYPRHHAVDSSSQSGRARSRMPGPSGRNAGGRLKGLRLAPAPNEISSFPSGWSQIRFPLNPKLPAPRLGRFRRR